MRPLTLLLVSAALAAAQDPATAPQFGSISGTVTETGGEPVKGADIYLNRGSKNEVHTLADQQGRYTLRDVPPGNVRVSAQAPSGTGAARFRTAVTRQLTLGPGQEVARFDFKLVIPGGISGKVLDQNGEPVAGIPVYLVAREYSSGALRQVYTGASSTDDQGQYYLTGVHPGRAYYVMAAARPRYPAISETPLDPKLRRPAVVPTYYPNSRELAGGQALTLRPREQREGIDIRMARAPSLCLEGVVMGIGGPGSFRFDLAETQPASGQVGNGGMYVGLPGGTSGPDGKVRVCGLHSGDYEFTVWDFGGRGGNSRLRSFGAQVFTIGDRDVAGARMTLGTLVQLSGEVMWDGPPPEKPPEGKFRLDLQAITRTNRGGAQLAIPGEFVFEEWLAPDEYGMKTTGVPAGLYIKDILLGGTSVYGETIRVGSGAASLRIVVGQNGGHVSARVADADGNPVPNCTVVLMPAVAESDASFAEALLTGATDRTGLFTSATRAPAKYLALATEDEIDHSPETIAKLLKARNRATEVEIPPKGEVAITLTVKPIE